MRCLLGKDATKNCNLRDKSRANAAVCDENSVAGGREQTANKMVSNTHLAREFWRSGSLFQSITDVPNGNKTPEIQG